MAISLQLSHNRSNGVLNYQHHDCLLRRRSKKHQSSASLAYVREIHRWPVNSAHKGPVTYKMYPFDDFIVWNIYFILMVTVNRNFSEQALYIHDAFSQRQRSCSGIIHCSPTAMLHICINHCTFWFETTTIHLRKNWKLNNLPFDYPHAIRYALPQALKAMVKTTASRLEFPSSARPEIESNSFAKWAQFFG